MFRLSCSIDFVQVMSLTLLTALLIPNFFNETIPDKMFDEFDDSGIGMARSRSTRGGNGGSSSWWRLRI